VSRSYLESVNRTGADSLATYALLSFIGGEFSSHVTPLSISASDIPCKPFCVGLVWLSIWVLACGFSQTLIQFCIFRALQGLGAACTVPSAVGILTSYFTGRERNLCLTIFGSAGALGFVVGVSFSPSICSLEVTRTDVSTLAY
jgi:MFS family permease